MRLRHGLIPAAVALAVSAGTAGPAPSGSIEGKVTYTGTAPPMKPIDMAKESTCAKEYNPPLPSQNVVTGPGDALQYVVVYISAGEEHSTAPSEPVRFDQKGCMYVPHILPMHAGQVLEIYTDDPFAHNIHPMPKHNPEWNKAQPPGSMPIHTKWENPEFIEVKCNIHSWMHGYFAVLNTSHYAVTDNTGSFTIKGLPPGKYTVTAWQERYGTQSQDIVVAETAAKANFTYKVTPYPY